MTDWSRFSNPTENPRWYAERTLPGRRRIVYGPFPDQEQATIAAYYLYPMEERNKLAAEGRLSLLRYRGVAAYTGHEIRVIGSSPEEFDFKSFEVKPASAVRKHSSWAALEKKYGSPIDHARKDLGL